MGNYEPIAGVLAFVFLFAMSSGRRREATAALVLAVLVMMLGPLRDAYLASLEPGTAAPCVCEPDAGAAVEP